MKRFACVLLALCFVLVGCGNGASKETVEKAKKAVAIVDDFLDGRIDESNAYKRLSEIRDTIKDAISDDEDSRRLSIYMGGVQTDILGYPSISTTTDILESRNELAKEFGLKTRKKSFE